MNHELGLHSSDERALTAKAAAYRALALNEQSLFVSSDGAEDGTKKQQMLTIIGSLHALEVADGHPREIFLEEVGNHMAASLKAFFQPRSVQLNHFLECYKNEATKYASIAEEATAWMQRISALRKNYFLPEILEGKCPTVSLVCDTDEHLNTGVSAKTERTEKDKRSDRTIVLLFNPAIFSLDSYFAIPYVLSHEFWCHGMGRWHVPQGLEASGHWTGCSPLDPWEEGWMDYVQFVLLQDVIMQMPTNAASIQSLVYRHCNQFSVQRYAGEKPILRGIGFGAADAFHRFLRQRERSFDLDGVPASGDDLFLHLSLDLNALDCELRLKSNFVSWIWNFLNCIQVSRQERVFSNVSSDRLLIEKRSALANILRSNFTETLGKTRKLGVARLLSLSGHKN